MRLTQENKLEGRGNKNWGQRRAKEMDPGDRGGGWGRGGWLKEIKKSQRKQRAAEKTGYIEMKNTAKGRKIWPEIKGGEKWEGSTDGTEGENRQEVRGEQTSSILVPVQLLGTAAHMAMHEHTNTHRDRERERESQPLPMMADTDTAMQRDGGGEGGWEAGFIGRMEDKEEEERGEQCRWNEVRKRWEVEVDWKEGRI